MSPKARTALRYLIHIHTSRNWKVYYSYSLLIFTFSSIKDITISSPLFEQNKNELTHSFIYRSWWQSLIDRYFPGSLLAAARHVGWNGASKELMMANFHWSTQLGSPRYSLWWNIDTRYKWTNMLTFCEFSFGPLSSLIFSNAKL